MQATALIWPAVTLVGLTAMVWVVLYVRRIRESQSKHIHPQKLSNRQAAAQLLEDTDAANNFSNLLEMPILFYAVISISLAIDFVSSTMVMLGWAFVVLRIVHSLIHITYNRVMHRFSVYIISSLFVWAMWVVLALHLMQLP